MVGFAPAELPDSREPGGPCAFRDWLQEGRHGDMGYMARDPEKRSGVTGWFPPAKSVVLLGFSYGSKPEASGDVPGFGRIAQYARSRDYHDELKARLKTLEAGIRQAEPAARTKRFVDTSPILERLYGRFAGIGWIGKNTMLLSRKIGSFFFLCGLALDRELIYDDPVPDHCGTCNRCIEACPTDAFPAPRVLDASRCIAYLTIEHRGAIPQELRPGVGNWLFGCDLCQEACPWNRFSIRNPAFEPKIPARLPLREIAAMTPEEFERELGDTPLERAGHAGLVRNALLVMENSR